MIVASIVRLAVARNEVWRRPLVFAAVLSCAGCPPAFAEEIDARDEAAAGTLVAPSPGALEAVTDIRDAAFDEGDAEGRARMPVDDAVASAPEGTPVTDSPPEAGDTGSETAGGSAAATANGDEAPDEASPVDEAEPAADDDEPAVDAETDDAETGDTEADDADTALDPDAGEDEEDGAVFQALETGQEAVTRTVVNLSRAMDRMLGAREVYPDEEYDSILRLRFFQRIDDSGGSRLEPRVSGRVSLPGAEQRWSVVFFSDDYNDPLDRERGTDRELEETTRGSVALRYLKPLRDRAKTSLSVGLRTGPVDMILRGRLWHEFDAGNLSIRPEQTVFWYDERGLGASSWLRFEYPLSGLKLLRSESGATWFKRDERFYYDQVFSLLQPLSQRRGLLWQIGMQAESRPNAHVTNYYAQVRWRSLIHRDWLIFEMRPQIFSDRANDFHFEHRLYVGFELLFGDSFRVR